MYVLCSHSCSGHDRGHLNSKQLKAKRQAKSAGVEKPETKPIMQITAGVLVLLFICSATYHTLTGLPY